MAKQEVGLKIDVDVSSVGNMKQQLRAATNELVAMNEKFGSTSKEAVAAAQKVAGLKDAIGDAKALAETFNPDKKFVALGGAVQGAAAGFSALQGAMGLFGAESKEVEQMLLKVQSAMALQQGISGIANAMDSFKLLAGQIATSSFALKANAVATNLASGAMKLFGVSVSTTSNAFRVLKGAIIATGIGALIVLAGELVNVLMDVADSSDEAAAAQKRLEKAQKDAADAIELQNKMLEGQIDLAKRNTDLAVNRAKATGASEEEITKLTRDGILKRQKLLKDDLEQRGIGTDQFYEKLKEFSKVNNELEDFDLNQQIKRREKLDADREKRIAKDDEKAKKRKEDAQKLAEDRAQEQKDINALIQKELDDQFAIDEAKRIENENEIKESNERIFQSQLEAAQKRAELQKNFNAESIAADIALQDAKFEAASAGLNALSTLAGDNEKLANVLFAIDKGLAIAKIIVDTQREIGGYFAANAEFKKGGGSAGAGAGGGGGNLTSPVPPQLSPQVTATQVNTAAVNQLGNQATRAYVLNSDIQNNDQRNAYINRNASIGNP